MKNLQLDRRDTQPIGATAATAATTGPAPSLAVQNLSVAGLDELRWPTDLQLRLVPAGTLALEVISLVTVVAISGWRDPARWMIGGLILLALFGSHQRRLHLSVISEAAWLGGRFTLAAVLAVPVLSRASDLAPLVDLFLIGIVAVLVMRIVSYAIVRDLRSRRLLLEPTLVVGSGETAERFVETVRRHPMYGLWAVGMIDDNDELFDTIGGLDDVSSLVEALRIRRVIVAPSVAEGYDHIRALRETQASGVTMHILPRVSELIPSSIAPSFDLIQGFPLYRVGPAQPSGPRWALKRVIDVAGACALLIASLPLLVVSAVGVLLSSRGPMLFHQTRVGRNGRPFTMLKFRTFPVDHVDQVFSLAHDECPLRWGRFLRRTSLDELPQLVNVIRGEMSLVGPRPERPQFARSLTDSVPGYVDRHRVAPGITGLAQVHGLWGNTSIDERVRLDNRYIDSWSLWIDLVVLAKTFPAVCRKSRS